MGFSSQLASKYPEVPPYVYYCYTKVSGFRLIPLHFGFSSIFYDFAISQEFLIKKREEDPQIFFLLLIVWILSQQELVDFILRSVVFMTKNGLENRLISKFSYFRVQKMDETLNFKFSNFLKISENIYILRNKSRFGLIWP